MTPHPATILALLTGLNLLNYLDRLVLSAVLPKVQETLHLSSFVAGALATVFLIGYFATSPIFGALAVVGIGEASYATLAPTIIDDMSPPDRKGRWLALFYVAIPIGSALGYLPGGFVEARWG